MKKYLLLIPAFFILSISFAQNSIPEAYRQAQIALESKKYWEVIPLFKQYTDPKEYGNLANYAAFHLGEAALGANQPNQAIDALVPLISRNWAKIDEARYLLTVAYFKNQQNVEALQLIKKIRSEHLKKMAENATFEHLKQSSSSFMISNLKEFKDNAGYTAALASVLESQTILSATERAAYYELKGKADANENRVKDGILDIVVILPFTNSNAASISNVSSTGFVFELFQGIEFGIEQLKQSGVKVNLQSFDSKRSLDQLQKILSDPVISKADIIIGPIYQEETDLVSNFAETAKIPFVHPLSNLGDRFEDTDYSYLFRPSVSSLAKGITQNLKHQMWGKRVAIGYSSNSRDIMLAELLKVQLEQEGFSIVKYSEVNSRNTNEFFQNLGVRRGAGRASTDQIILLSDDPSIAQPTFSLMESITSSVPTLVMDSWLGFNFANYEMLEFPNFYFIGNNSINFHAESMRSWKRDFYKKYLSLPSMNTTLGRELIYWLSTHMTETKGFDLRRNLDRAGYERGQLTWGFNFQNSHNNQYVPVFRFDAGELIPLQ